MAPLVFLNAKRGHILKALDTQLTLRIRIGIPGVFYISQQAAVDNDGEAKGWWVGVEGEGA